MECLTINVHFVKDRPKPDSAPYRDAIVWQKHISNKNPIQLNKNATVIEIHIISYIYNSNRNICTYNMQIYIINLPKNAVKNIKSVPSNPLSGSPSAASVSIANIVKGLGGVLIFSGYKSVIWLCDINLIFNIIIN